MTPRKWVFLGSFRLLGLQSEGTPPEAAFNPVVKRSGWQPPQDSGLWKIADDLEQKVTRLPNKLNPGVMHARTLQ